MSNRILLLFIFLVSFGMIYADDEVKLTASAPGTVVMGKPFQITYTANSKVTDFKAPAITNFDVLAGPFKSESYSSQVVNGNVSSSVSIAFTYTLQPQKTGTFTIPSAAVTAGGQKYTSNGLSIKVLPADDSSGNASAGSSSSSSSSSASAASISEKNIFIRPVLSRNSVYEQEAVTFSYKLYTTYDVVQSAIKSMPDFKGFLKQEIPHDGNTQLAYESYNGKNYLTAVLYDVVLYPQSSGEIKIDKATFEAIIRVQNRQRVRSIFDDFFDTYTNVPKVIDVAPVKINVKSLPAGKPSDFYGVVGQFSLNSSLSSQKVKMNEAVTLKINFTGSGNMKLIKNPEIDFPDAFEVYDPKVTNNFKPSSSGITGNKSIEIMFIPRHTGTFEIPSVGLSYFDPKEQKYKTIKTPVYSVQVLKGDGTAEENPIVTSFSGKEDVKQLGNDIRYIHTGKINVVKSEGYLIDNLTGWLMFLIPLLISVALYIVFRKRVKDNADIGMVKNRKANKIARKRLTLAQKLLSEGSQDKFYEEVMKAVWSYLSDKLTIPVAELNKEKITVVLSEKNVDESVIEKLTEILNTCEYARFAPGGLKEMGNLYEDAIQVISTLEGLIKK